MHVNDGLPWPFIGKDIKRNWVGGNLKVIFFFRIS